MIAWPSLLWLSAFWLLVFGITFLPRPVLRERVLAGFAALAVALAVFTAVRYLIRARHVIGDVDFYFFVCFARDLAAGLPDVSELRYSYFPGVYWFWRGALALGGGSLLSLQWIYAAVLVVDASLVGGVIWRAHRRCAPAVFAAAWYLALCLRFEGLRATTEPIATLPVLVGLLLWGGRPIRELRVAAAIGVALGLGIYAKQQGVLLAVGALTIAIDAVLGPKSERHRPLAVALIAALAAGVPAFGLWAEGEGEVPFRIGLGMIGAYAHEGTLASNLPFPYEPTLGLAALVATVLVIRGRWLFATVDADARARTRITSFAILGGLAGLAQFSARPYHHYLLLSLPLLIIAIVVSLQEVLSRAGRYARPLALALCVVPFTRSAASEGRLTLWPPKRALREFHYPPWHEAPTIARDLGAIAQRIHRGDDALVLPPRRNDVHFHLGTRARSFRLGYAWLESPGATVAAVRSRSLADVVVLKPSSLDGSDQANWKLLECDDAIAELGPQGFVRVLDLETMELWQRGVATGTVSPDRSTPSLDR